MTLEERTRIGKKLKGLRTQEGLTQADVVAAMPKGQRISVATVKAIENARTKYLVRDSNIETYAAFFGTSTTALLREDDPRPILATNPLLEDLHDEHLELARRYVFARNQVRAGVDMLLDPQTAGALPLAGLLLAVAPWAPEHLVRVRNAVVHAKLSEADLAQLLTRLVTDAEFLEAVRRLLRFASDDVPATAPATTARSKPTGKA